MFLVDAEHLDGIDLFHHAVTFAQRMTTAPFGEILRASRGHRSQCAELLRNQLVLARSRGRIEDELALLRTCMCLAPYTPEDQVRLAGLICEADEAVGLFEATCLAEVLAQASLGQPSPHWALAADKLKKYRRDNPKHDALLGSQMDARLARSTNRRPLAAEL